MSYIRDEAAMCRGDRLIADFVAGNDAKPGLTEVLDEHLTTTVDGLWVVWAYKLARQEGDLFVPLTGPPGYPADARAFCRSPSVWGAHDAPDPRCTCGFHAVSSRDSSMLRFGRGFSVLTVALSGRVLAFEWAGGGVLWRAERQTVVRIEQPGRRHQTELERLVQAQEPEGVQHLSVRRHPDDPGRLAVVRPTAPRDCGPIRLSLPVSAPVLPVCHDDAGWCVVDSTLEQSPTSLVLV
jgi:hypothetical protein